MSLIKLNNRAVKNVSSLSGLTSSIGDLVFISKQTASSSASISFTSGIDSTYKEYIFFYLDIHPSANGGYFQVNFRDGDSNFDATKTTTLFAARHNEDDATATLSYYSNNDLTQSTGVQFLDSTGVNNNNDTSVCGILTLYNPSSTTFVKHFTNENIKSSNATHDFVAGYCNTTSAIDGVQFTFQSGNIDSGDIILYGVN